MAEPMDTEEQAIVRVLISMYLDSHAAADGTPCECNACDTAREWGYLPLPHTMAVDSLRLCLDWLPGDAAYSEATNE